jgi:hypothetical protein
MHYSKVSLPVLKLHKQKSRTKSVRLWLLLAYTAYQLKSLSHLGVISDVVFVLVLLGADSLFLNPPESFASFELEN